MPLDFGTDEYKGSGEYNVLPQDSVVVLRIDLERDKENPDPNSNLFYHSTQPNSNVLYMKWKFTVLNGEFTDTWFRNNQTVAGGSTNATGQSKGAVITGRMARQIIESNRGIRSDATDPNSAAARVLQNDWPDLDGMIFLGKVGVEPASAGYSAKNKLVAGIPPDHKDFYEWRTGGPQAAPAAPMAPMGAPAAAPAPPTAAAAPAGAPGAPAAAPAAPAGGLTGGFAPPPAAASPPAGAPAGGDGQKPDWA